MAAKKRGKKVAKKKSVAKKSVKPTRNKIRIVLKNLFLFAVLTLISYILKLVSGNEVYQDFFLLLMWILGIIALAFLIILLVLVLIKALRK